MNEHSFMANADVGGTDDHLLHRFGATLDRVMVGSTAGLTPAQDNGTLTIPTNSTFAVRFRAVKK